MNQIIQLIDENGVQKDFQFLFAFNKQDTDEEFAFFIEKDVDAPEVAAFKWGQDGQLHNLESQDEWDFASDIFNAYMAQMQGGGCSCCSGGCGGDCGDGCGDNCGDGCECDCEH